MLSHLAGPKRLFKFGMPAKSFFPHHSFPLTTKHGKLFPKIQKQAHQSSERQGLTVLGGHRETPSEPLERGGARKVSALTIPFCPAGCPTQFSRDFRHLSCCALRGARSQGAEGGGAGETVQTARPPSCLRPRSARAVFRDARFPLPSAAPGPLNCPTAQQRGGGCFLPWTPE